MAALNRREIPPTAPDQLGELLLGEASHSSQVQHVEPYVVSFSHTLTIRNFLWSVKGKVGRARRENLPQLEPGRSYLPATPAGPPHAKPARA